MTRPSALVAALLPWAMACTQPPRPSDGLESSLARGERGEQWRLLEQHVLPELPCPSPQLPGSDR